MRLAEFFHMGGYGFYVWGSYLIALIAMGGEVVLLMRRKRSLLDSMDQDSIFEESKRNEKTS